MNITGAMHFAEKWATALEDSKQLRSTPKTTWEEKVCYPSHLRLLKGLILNSYASIKLQWKGLFYGSKQFSTGFALGFRIYNRHWVETHCDATLPHHIKVTKMSLQTVLSCLSCWKGKSFKLAKMALVCLLARRVLSLARLGEHLKSAKTSKPTYACLTIKYNGPTISE